MATNLLTAVEVARRLRVSRATVYRWAEDGTLAAVRIGGTVRFHPDVVAALMSDDGPEAA